MSAAEIADRLDVVFHILLSPREPAASIHGKTKQTCVIIIIIVTNNITLHEHIFLLHLMCNVSLSNLICVLKQFRNVPFLLLSLISSSDCCCLHVYKVILLVVFN